MIGLFACTPETGKNIPGEPIKISLRISSPPPAVKFSEMVNSIRLVPLEKSPDCMIGQISQVDQVDGKIFVMDFDRKRGIMVFDEKGKFLYKFGGFGKGPGEYTDLIGFSFSTDLKSIYLVAADQKKVIEYSLDGELIGDKSLGAYYSDMQFLNNTDYVAINRRGYYFRLGNIDTGAFLDTVKWSTGQLAIGGRLLFRAAEGHYLYSATHFDTVYSISQEALYPKYCFDFGPNKCTPAEQDAYLESNGYPYPPNKLLLDFPFLETKELFYFGVTSETKPGRYGRAMMALNRKTKEIFKISEDDILYSGTYHAMAITCQSEFVSFVHPTYLIEKRDQILNNEDYNYPDGFMNIIRAMEEEDNPVLVFYTFR